ncbi:hypothetical protein HK405_003759 [Cladochytrium tenue]|nr:hypothetical protein HK405_003759 [Cladochytrium tenue]
MEPLPVVMESSNRSKSPGLSRLESEGSMSSALDIEGDGAPNNTSVIDPRMVWPRWLQEIAGLDEDMPHHFAAVFEQIERESLRHYQDALRDRQSWAAAQTRLGSAIGTEEAGFDQAQAGLSCTAGYSFRAASDSRNLARNRYSDVVPYDYCRVRLQHPSPLAPPFVGASDYVNASYITTNDDSGGGSAQRMYIAAQGPLPGTVGDFWGMVWDHDVRVIVMLTGLREGGRVKCHRYWPEPEHHPGSTITLDDASATEAATATEPLRVAHGAGWQLVVEWHGETLVRAGCVLREFQVTRRRLLRDGGGDDAAPPRTVRQVHFTEWADHRAADVRAVLDVVGLVDELQRAAGPAAGPTVVHCSAGCGRTGAFCTIDSVVARVARGLRRRWFGRDGSAGAVAEDDESVDLVAATARRLREQRPFMVQTKEQFELCYEAVVQWLLDSQHQQQQQQQQPPQPPQHGADALHAAAKQHHPPPS